jgi:SAM-dependent methyltransferase
LDLGTGNGEFINSVRAERKFAVDLNPGSRNKMISSVEFVETSSTDLSKIENESIDTIFTSNFFEHLPNAESLVDTLNECHACLKPAGTLVVLIPNIKYVKGDFWDYLDHTLPLTHRSMVEALQIAKFDVTEVYPRFLPYTIKNRRFQPPLALLKLYLKLQWLWPIFGKQMLVVARPSALIK